MVEFVFTQLMLVPLLGGFWLGIRQERQRQQQLLFLATQALGKRRR